ncbi:MAG: hypothetical protein QW568_01505 [Candidatus Anstonellaceae archaeon]
MELSIKPKSSSQNPFAEQALLVAKMKTEENTGEAFKIMAAAISSFKKAGIAGTETEKALKEMQKKGTDIKVSFGVQYA